MRPNAPGPLTQIYIDIPPNATPSVTKTALFGLTTIAFSMPVDKSRISTTQFDHGFTRGIPKVNPRYTPGQLEVYLWFTSGLPQVDLWLTTGSPLVDHRFTSQRDTPNIPQLYPR